MYPLLKSSFFSTQVCVLNLDGWFDALSNYSPSNKTWRRRNDVSLYVQATSQICLKWNTQRRLGGTSPVSLSGTSPRRIIGTSWRLKRALQWRLISMSPRRLKQGSNETPNNVSVVRYQNVSVVRIHFVPLLSLYNVSCKSQTNRLNNVPLVRLHQVSELRCCTGL